MLKLKNIVKDYVSGNNVTHALKGISVNFRRNEFVSILGASGCGKTTTLNIIGGLDRYTSGDLLINGKSTKEYKDRDWDTYRNHSIGFVFQTYNLISHQSILKNVELALTISGVNRDERKTRAMEALKLVGLEGMEKKKPNQLSGGQCQRVAIARALINNPEILLADEPTGALDSETSVQIMELLKKVASDRLVIMVTHNPDLAMKYSTRIIRMSDGLLIDDSNPFEGEKYKKTKATEEVKDTSKGKKKKTSMSLITSAGLSTANLFSKIKRTILVTIAGSIGIIGITSVLAVSTGVKDYIDVLQEDMLSSYPLQIAEESLDYTSLMTGLSTSNVKDALEFDPNTQVGVDSMIDYLMNTYTDLTNVKTNTIDQKLLDYIDSLPAKDVAVITKNYGIDPTNNIFGKWDDSRTGEQYISFNGLTQRYIAELNTVSGFESYSAFVNLFTAFMDELPDNTEYLSEQYDFVAGDKISNGEDDLVLVVDKDTTLTDLLFAQMGIFPHDQFIKIALCAMEEQKLKNEPGYEKWSNEYKAERINAIRNDEKFKYDRQFDISNIVGRDFYYFPENTIYQGGPDAKVADAEMSFDINFNILNSGNLDTFVSLSFQNMFGYNLLYGQIIYNDGNNNYVTKTVACMGFATMTKENVETVADLNDTYFAFDPADLLAMQGLSEDNYMSFITEKALFSFTLDSEHPDNQVFSMKDPLKYNVPINPKIEPNPNPINGYYYNAVADNSWISNPSAQNVNGRKMKITSILRLKDDKQFGTLSRGLYYSKAFGDKYRSEAKESKVTKELMKFISKNGDSAKFNNAYVKFDYLSYKEDRTNGELKTGGYAPSINGDFSSAIGGLFSGMSVTNYLEENETLLRSISGQKILASKDEDGKLTNVEFKSYPKGIKIYPRSFEAKDNITKYLNKWNSEETLNIKGVNYDKDPYHTSVFCYINCISR